MVHSCLITLSETSYAHNIRFLRSVLPRGVRIASVVKGNAYGHGIEVFVPMAERQGISDFAVFSAVEAARVLEVCNRDTDIMIMGFIDARELQWAIREGVSHYVFDLDRLTETAAAAKAVGKPAKVHLELETGLHRTGLETDALGPAIRLLRAESRWIEVTGTCTHLAGAESVANFLRIREQLELFHERCRYLESQGVDTGLRHVASSAGALMIPETALDMVRIGISQYGFWPSREARIHWLLKQRSSAQQRIQDPLERVLTWRSHVMGLKEIKTGDFVGYGITFQAPRPLRLAAVPVGYFHGFSRDLSNRGYVLIGGSRAPVTGLVNMNIIMVDVTECPPVAVGDEVIIIGHQGQEEITLAAFGDLSGLLNYEILARIPERVPRTVEPPISPES